MARNVMLGGAQSCIAAFQLLTRLPFRVSVPYTEAVLSRSVAFYPLVGAVIGGILAVAGWLLERGLPPLPGGMILLAVWVYLTGALHLDGLMDMADGLLSHRSRERMLEIMKDSRVGAMGVIVGALVLLLKGSMAASLLGEGDWGRIAPYLIGIPLWSRWWMAMAVGCWPYARQEPGMGASLRGVRAAHLLVATMIAGLLSWTVLLGFGHAPLAAVCEACAMATVAGFAGWAMARQMAGKLGGLTGDTYGALCELTETALLLALLLASYQGWLVA